MIKLKLCICLRNIMASEILYNVTEDYIYFKIGKIYHYYKYDDMYQINRNNKYFSSIGISENDFKNIFMTFWNIPKIWKKYSYTKPEFFFNTIKTRNNPGKCIALGNIKFPHFPGKYCDINDPDIIYKKGDIIDYYISFTELIYPSNPQESGKVPYLKVKSLYSPDRSYGFPLWMTKKMFNHIENNK